MLWAGEALLHWGCLAQPMTIDTSQEACVVQVFAEILTRDYLYPRTHLQVQPQWRVKSCPSDTRKNYPVDIAVFASTQHMDSNLQIVVECKKSNRRDGRTQLEDYLRLSRAYAGVWFNGNEKLFLKKIEKDGRVFFEEIPNIPRFGERLEDVGLYCRRDLVPAQNLKSVFKSIRNYLAANAVGITRDEALASQIINLIFCKIHDERFTGPDEMVSFRAGIKESREGVCQRIKSIFNCVKQQYNDVIEQKEVISLDNISLCYVVGELQMFCLTESQQHAVSEAFEVFIGPSLKGGQGQFFTPRNTVRLLTDMVCLGLNDRLIDPACGSGGFLVEALRKMWEQVNRQGKDLGWSEQEIISEKQKIARHNIRGIDKDQFLAKVAKAYMAIIGDGRSGVFCQNALVDPMADETGLGSFDAVLTNPPFGKKLKIDDRSILSKYQLGHKGGQIRNSQSPQILFIERCLNLLKPGGRLGIVVPESMLCNPSYRYIVQYIKSVARIRAVVSFPEELFQPFTHTKVCGVLIEKTNAVQGIFMATAKRCGHDSRGNPIQHDDIPCVTKRYNEYVATGKTGNDRFGFVLSEADISNDIYLPKYYNPGIKRNLRMLESTHRIIRLGDLVREGILTISTGDEVGKLAYGTGRIPFVRSSDIANWEIKLDPKHSLSAEIYEKYKGKQDVQTGDILMVRDGTYLVGTCAIISSANTKIVYQSHIYKIRINNKKTISPELLLVILSSPIV